MPTRTQFGHPVLGVTLLSTLALMKALDVTENVPYETFRVNDGSVAGAMPLVYYYHPTSALTADDLFVVAPTTGAGRYLLAPNLNQDVAIPIAFGTADAAVLVTLPTNSVVRVTRPYWEVTADFTGGSSSAIGLSSSNAGFNTKGDLLGGASGDVAATLVAASGKLMGTIGAKIAAGILLKGGNTVRFDRVTSAFTAGTGFAHLVCEVFANPGV